MKPKCSEKFGVFLRNTAWIPKVSSHVLSGLTKFRTFHGAAAPELPKMERMRCQEVRAAWANAAAKGFVMKPGLQLLRTHNRKKESTEVPFSSLEMQHRAVQSKFLSFLITHKEQPRKCHQDLVPAPHGTHSNLLNARNGAPLIGIFRLYSIKGGKKGSTV